MSSWSFEEDSPSGGQRFFQSGVFEVSGQAEDRVLCGGTPAALGPEEDSDAEGLAAGKSRDRGGGDPVRLGRGNHLANGGHS